MFLQLNGRNVELTDAQGGKLLAAGRALAARPGVIILAFGYTVDDPIVVGVLEEVAEDDAWR